MSTVPLSRPGRAARARLVETAGAARLAPVALAVALLLVLLYAGFAHGAAALATEARVQVAIDVIVVIAGAAWVWSGALTIGASGRALAGVGLLAAFACWSGLSVLWSVAPDQTWIELNRAITYLLVLLLGMALGSSARNAADLITGGFLLVALAVTCYALGQKIAPGLHIRGVFDLNQAGTLPRLQEPLGYWNALALLISFGVPIALALAVDRGRSDRLRIGALISMQLMLLTIGLTYSRGALIALAVGLAVAIALSGARLRSLMWLAAGILAALPPLIFGLADHSLNSANVPLSSREGAGMALLLVLAVSSICLSLGARRLHGLERTVNVGPERAKGIGRLLAWTAAAILAAALVLLTLSARGLPGTVSHAWKSFTATRVTSTYDPQRLLSASSENRWVWWKEAAGAFSDRPIAGWGAGSFSVVHRLYRRDRLSVDQPHSVPLQFLSDTGIVGAALALGAFALLIWAAIRTVRRHEPGRPRLLAGALLSGVVIFAVHCLYDWDWDIPAVTLPALVFLGVLVGTGRGRERMSLGPAARGMALGALTLAACTFALSDALPSIAASQASHAIVEAAGSAASVAHAQSTAQLASRLDPLSNAGLLVEATIAIRRGRLDQARSYLLSAVDREPSDSVAWQQLAFVELSLGDERAGIEAGNRAIALDPIFAQSSDVVGSAPPSVTLSRTPPSDSATARPLPERRSPRGRPSVG